MRDKDKKGAAEDLREYYNGGPDGHVVEIKNGLRVDKRLLYIYADVEAVDYIIVDLFGVINYNYKGREKAGADNYENRREIKERRVIVYYYNSVAGDDGHYY